MDRKKITIFALAAHGDGISGGDRIFIEFARRWSKKVLVEVIVWEEGYQMCLRQKLELSKVKFTVSKLEKWKKLGFLMTYFASVVEGVKLGIFFKFESDKNENILYSASDFLMDVLPSFIIKIRYPKIKWVATWYQTAPNPLKGFSEFSDIKRYRLTALLYWLSQKLVKPLIDRSADKILVNNETEKEQFIKRLNDVVVVLGAVDTESINEWTVKNRKIKKKYDAVFQGRFHPQKGVVELIDIWKVVSDIIPNAKLAMIGDGPLLAKVKAKIENYRLENNIKLFGYVYDGPKKYGIFSQSKIVVHPSFYDSGGMAAAEAMAFGLPCVGFDLKAYESYYPKGMVKVKVGIDSFAQVIVRLLNNSKIREKIGREAEKYIKSKMTWNYRSEEILSKIV